MAADARKVPGKPGNFPAISVQEVLYRVAGVEIDLARASVTRNGEVIDLRYKTYQVLLFLLQRPNRVVSKEELLDGVWPNTAVSDDVLPHCIAELRKAFGDQAKEQRVIKTYPKSGYGLVAPIEVRDASPAVLALAPTAPIEDRPLPRNRRPIAIAAGALVLPAVAAIVWLVWIRPAPVEILREVGWWKLDEGHGLTASDSSGNGELGKLTGTAAWVPGPRSMACGIHRHRSIRSRDVRARTPRRQCTANHHRVVQNQCHAGGGHSHLRVRVGFPRSHAGTVRRLPAHGWLYHFRIGDTWRVQRGRRPVGRWVMAHVSRDL